MVLFCGEREEERQVCAVGGKERDRNGREKKGEVVEERRG